MIHSLAGVTILTPDLDKSVAAYRDWLGYRLNSSGFVSPGLAETWGQPAAEGAKQAVLTPASGEARFIRLIEGAHAPDFRPLLSYGWAAVEIIVEDVDQLAERLRDSPFSIIGPPTPLDFNDQIKAMQVIGPAQEVLYLTEIKGEIAGFRLPVANSFVGQVFIMVLAAPSIAVGAAPYQNHGCPLGPEFPARIDCLSAAHGLPLGTHFPIATLELGERSLIEVDAAPAATLARGPSSLGLPSGIAMVSFFGDQSAFFFGAAGEGIEILVPGTTL